MSKKSSVLMKLSKYLLALAPAIILGEMVCSGFVGESELPEKSKNIE